MDFARNFQELKKKVNLNETCFNEGNLLNYKLLLKYYPQTFSLLILNSIKIKSYLLIFYFDYLFKECIWWKLPKFISW